MRESQENYIVLHIPGFWGVIHSIQSSRGPSPSEANPSGTNTSIRPLGSRSELIVSWRNFSTSVQSSSQLLRSASGSLANAMGPRTDTKDLSLSQDCILCSI